ncbi:MAG: NrpR regulatory domain-containing protein [Chloroflexota bacterium]
MSFETQGVERKILSILKVLYDLQKPAGGRIIAQHLKDHGVSLSERAVRYHLRIMDERGLTELVGNRDGRTITEKGFSEIQYALVKDKVGFAITKIEQLAFRTDFDFETRRGTVPVNISFFPKVNFKKALLAMRPAFDAGLCVSRLVATAESGQRVGDVFIPEDKVGLVTVCSIVVNGALLKAGIPMDSRFSGILQITNRKPMRFTEIIHYDGCSLDPSEIFIKARMTSVGKAVSIGSGGILANFREVPAICLPVVERVLAGLKAAGLEGVLMMGNTSEPVCEVPVEPNKIGLVLAGGLNPVAAAQEAGIESENKSMSTVIEYQDLIKLTELFE